MVASSEACTRFFDFLHTLPSGRRAGGSCATGGRARAAVEGQMGPAGQTHSCRRHEREGASHDQGANIPWYVSRRGFPSSIAWPP